MTEIKCRNCNQPALYIYKLTATRTIPYCKTHLPRFLDSMRRAGNLETTEAYDRKAREALDALKPKPAVFIPPVVHEEPVVEEAPDVFDEPLPEIEEPVAPPKPRKKSKPKAVEHEGNS